jgi:hypothetical protein
MEQTIEVGSISFFVANPIYGEVKLSDEDSETLAKEFEDEFVIDSQSLRQVIHSQSHLLNGRLVVLT